MSLRKTQSAEERPMCSGSPGSLGASRKTQSSTISAELPKSDSTVSGQSLPKTDSTVSGQSMPSTASISSSCYQSRFTKEENLGRVPLSHPPGLEPTASVVSNFGCRTDSAHSTSLWRDEPAYISTTAKMKISIVLWQPDDDAEHGSPVVDVDMDKSAQVSHLFHEVNRALCDSLRVGKQVAFFRSDGEDDEESNPHLPMQEALSVLDIEDGHKVFAGLKMMETRDALHPPGLAMMEPAKIAVTKENDQDNSSPHIGTSNAHGSSSLPAGAGGYQADVMNLGVFGNGFNNPQDWNCWNAAQLHAAQLQMLNATACWQQPPIGAYPFMYGQPPVPNESFANLGSPIQEVPLEGIDVEPFLVPITWAHLMSDGVHHVVHKGEKGAWHHYIFWVIDSKKLETTDKQLLSPKIMLPLGADGAGEPFVLMIRPKISYLSKGGGSFKKAKGKATISIKCMSHNSLREDDAKLKFRMMVGSRDPLKQQSARGPIDHNFDQNSTADLPKDLEQWNLVAAVDEITKKFIVALEVQNLKLDGGRDEV